MKDLFDTVWNMSAWDFVLTFALVYGAYVLLAVLISCGLVWLFLRLDR